ncbi:hypothetical protein EPN16_00130 [bacterium]|nr:MAG: hypothetical protein EPN16_00130 [bacterium]
MIKHITRISTAIILVLAGIAGIVLPFIPGLLLIFLGVAVFLDKNPKALFQVIKGKLKAKYQKECALDYPKSENNEK